MKRTWNTINEIASLKIIQNPPQELASDHETIRDVYTQFSECQKRLDDLTKTMKKFVDRAKEPNEEARFYGPETNDEILQYSEKYEMLKGIVGDQLSRWLPSYLPLSQADEAERLIKQEEARKMEEMRRQAMLQLQKMEMDEEVEEQKARERRRREMEAEQVERRKVDLDKERLRAAEVDSNLAMVRKRKQEKLAKRKEMEDLVRNAKGHTFSESFQIVLSKNPDNGIASCKRALMYILTNLIKHPDMEEVRRLRISNQRLQSDLFQWSGGLQCLVSLGFELHDLAAPGVQNVEVQDANWFLIVDEPDMMTDMNGWEEWHNQFRYAIGEIQNS